MYGLGDNICTLKPIKYAYLMGCYKTQYYTEKCYIRPAIS